MLCRCVDYDDGDDEEFGVYFYVFFSYSQAHPQKREKIFYEKIILHHKTCRDAESNKQKSKRSVMMICMCFLCQFFSVLNSLFHMLIFCSNFSLQKPTNAGQIVKVMKKNRSTCCLCLFFIPFKKHTYNKKDVLFFIYLFIVYAQREKVTC